MKPETQALLEKARQSLQSVEESILWAENFFKAAETVLTGGKGSEGGTCLHPGTGYSVGGHP